MGKGVGILVTDIEIANNFIDLAHTWHIFEFVLPNVNVFFVSVESGRLVSRCMTQCYFRMFFHAIHSKTRSIAQVQNTQFENPINRINREQDLVFRYDRSHNHRQEESGFSRLRYWIFSPKLETNSFFELRPKHQEGPRIFSKFLVHKNWLTSLTHESFSYRHELIFEKFPCQQSKMQENYGDLRLCKDYIYFRSAIFSMKVSKNADMTFNSSLMNHKKLIYNETSKWITNWINEHIDKSLNQIQSYWSIFRAPCTARIATSRTIIGVSIVATKCESKEYRR